MLETLCELDWLNAEYEGAQTTQSTEPNFRISVTAPTGPKLTFVVPQSDGDQFAAELDVLTALIRAKVVRARLKGWTAVSRASS